jgi:hypothetical protein
MPGENRRLLENIAKYEGGKNYIQKEAKNYEHVPDDAKHYSQVFGIVIYLQIAILLSSISPDQEEASLDARPGSRQRRYRLFLERSLLSIWQELIHQP